METPHVLVAADKFKGSLTAVQVAERVTAGLRRVVPGARVETLPVADGGDGTVAAAVAAGFERRETRVTGPLGTPVTAAYAVRDTTAVVEMAEASGLQHLPHGGVRPAHGDDVRLRGTADGRPRRGRPDDRVRCRRQRHDGRRRGHALRARGALPGRRRQARPPGGAALAELAEADLTGLDPRLADVDLILASDVDNPLTGPKGAPEVYGRQKGATEDDIAVLDAALVHYASVLGPGTAELPGAGAAGGIGYGALVALGARFRPGIEVMLDVLGFAPALARATLVVTGEGSLDEQTLHGKAPAGVAAAARTAGVETVAVCGRLALPPEALVRAGISRAYALTDLEPDPAVCMAQAGPLLERAAEAIARDFLS